MADETAEVVESTEPVEQTQDAPVAEEVTPDEQHDQDVSEQTTPESEETTEEAQAESVEEPDEQAPQVQPLAPVDASQFVDPESGVFDVNAYNQAMIANQQQTIQAATSQIRAEMEYKGQWDEAIKEFPELKNAKTRDMVAAYHIQQSTNGKYVSPKKAAKEFFDFANGKAVAAKESGKKEATETTRVQASAHLETSGASTKSADTVSDLKTKLNNATDNAERSKISQQLLKELVQSGRI